MSYSEIFLISICGTKCLSAKLKKKKEILNNFSKFMEKRTDIISFVKQKRDIELIKSSIFTENEKLMLKFVSKPKYKNLESMLDLKRKESSIENFYSNYKLIKNQGKTETSQRIFNLLS